MATPKQRNMVKHVTKLSTVHYVRAHHERDHVLAYTFAYSATEKQVYLIAVLMQETSTLSSYKTGQSNKETQSNKQQSSSSSSSVAASVASASFKEVKSNKKLISDKIIHTSSNNNNNSNNNILKFSISNRNNNENNQNVVNTASEESRSGANSNDSAKAALVSKEMQILANSFLSAMRECEQAYGATDARHDLCELVLYCMNNLIGCSPKPDLDASREARAVQTRFVLPAFDDPSILVAAKPREVSVSWLCSVFLVLYYSAYCLVLLLV